MLSEFIEKQLKRARYKILDDGTYFGTILGFRGVWANAKNLENCRKELREVFEDWFLLKVRNREKIHGFELRCGNFASSKHFAGRLGKRIKFITINFVPAVREEV